MKIVTVIGARPQFIKAAVVSRAIAQHPDMQEIIVHTGQHFDENMSDIFFEEMQIPKPDYNLHINGLGHGAMTGQMLEKIEAVLVEEKPDWVLVYGDTNSTLAGALAACKLHINVAHVEAGLRSFNTNMPEEINRILTDRISNLLLCPTETAMRNLEQEGFGNFGCRAENIGDVMQDAALFYAPRAKQPAQAVPEDFILCTVHRAENTDDNCKLQNLFGALEQISAQTTVVLPLHPRTRKKLESAHYDFGNSRICFIEPVGYLEMVWLLSHCRMVMTDSGGLQKEAYFFKKFCLTLREETEWVELVENGVNRLVGTDRDTITAAAAQCLAQPANMTDSQLYGNGHAGEKVVEMVYNYRKS